MFTVASFIPISAKDVVMIRSVRDVVMKDIVKYYATDDILREITTFNNYHNYNIENFYLACLICSIPLYIEVYSKSRKLESIIEYSTIKKVGSMFLLIFTFVFTKNIENAI